MPSVLSEPAETSLLTSTVTGVTVAGKEFPPLLSAPTGEGIGYPLQYSWASFVTYLVKNLPTMQETWVGKIPLEKGKATYSSILA